jgi:hypothetical protein
VGGRAGGVAAETLPARRLMDDSFSLWIVMREGARRTVRLLIAVSTDDDYLLFLAAAGESIGILELEDVFKIITLQNNTNASTLSIKTHTKLSC